MNIPYRPALVSLTLALSFAVAVRADITLAPLFTNHAVLQRDKPLPIWGTGEVGEKVTVTFGAQRREGTVGHDGRWLVILDPLPASTTGSDLTLVAKNTITLRNVVVGDVWLGSGGANMEWSVVRSTNARAEIAAANFPLIRQVKIQRASADGPAATVNTSGWETASRATVGNFTAVGYYFARDIHEKTGVPIGIVNSTWEGTPIESWMSPASLAGNPAFAGIIQRWQQNLVGYAERSAEYQERLAGWTRMETQAKAAVNARVDAAFHDRIPVRLDPHSLYND